MRSAAFLIAALLGGALLLAPPPQASATDAEAAVTPESEINDLPPGPGRDAVYYTCRACHSDKQFTQQRLSRDEWDELLTAMVRENGMAEPEPWARTLMLNYLSTHFSDLPEDEWQGLPPGHGREEVFYLCAACHSLAIVKQQGLDQDGWAETLDWMVEEQGMPELETEERTAILEYLSTHYGP